MKLRALFLLSITLVGVQSGKLGGPRNLQLSWSNCGTASDPIKVTRLEVVPDTISIPGLVSLSLDVQVARNISSPIKADVAIKKKSFIGWIEIPCLDNVGSCNYEDLCRLSHFSNPCPLIFKKYNIPCTCPINEGSYSVQQFPITIRKIGPHWLEHGKYKGRISLSDDFQLLACYEFNCSLN